MPSPTIRLLLWLCLAMLAPPACDSRKSEVPAFDPWTAKHPDPKNDPVVATVAGHPIHASAVKRQAEQTGVNARAALDALIDLEVLAGRARELNFPPNATTLRAQKRAMVDAYLRDEFEPTITFDNLKDEDLRPIYERAKSVFVRPRAVRTFAMSINAGEKFKRTFDEALALARDLESTLKRKKSWSSDALIELANEPRWAAISLRLSSNFIQHPAGPFEGEAADRILALKTVGEFTPIFKNAVGYHLAMCLEIFEAKNVTFEQMRDEIRTTYFPRWQKERFLKHANTVAQRLGVTVNDEALSKLDAK
jgi:hypothetical protein